MDVLLRRASDVIRIIASISRIIASIIGRGAFCL
jgi:hypothetical protein